jgi:hypothetical protein
MVQEASSPLLEERAALVWFEVGRKDRGRVGWERAAWRRDPRAYDDRPATATEPEARLLSRSLVPLLRIAFSFS